VFKSLNLQVEIMSDRSLLRKIGNGLSYVTPIGAGRLYIAARESGCSRMEAAIMPAWSEFMKILSWYVILNNLFLKPIEPLELALTPALPIIGSLQYILSEKFYPMESKLNKSILDRNKGMLSQDI
jgi:hypothetical protein